MKRFQLFIKENKILAIVVGVITLLLILALFLGFIYLSKGNKRIQMYNMDDIFAVKPSKFKGENIWG